MLFRPTQRTFFVDCVDLELLLWLLLVPVPVIRGSRRHFLPGVVDSESVAVGHVGDGRGSRVGNSEQSWGSGNGLDSSVHGWVSVSWGGIGWGGIGRGVVGWGMGVGSRVGSGHVSDGQSGVTDAHIGLAHRRVRGVDGLGMGRDLAQVSISAQDVGLLAGDCRGVDSGVGRTSWVQRVSGLAHGNGGGEDDELWKESESTV